MPTSSWMRLFNRDPSGSPPMRCTPCTDSCPSTSIHWYGAHLELRRSRTDGTLKAPTKDDTLRVILSELDGVPNVGSDELNEARDTAIELQLSNRFARVKGELIATIDSFPLTSVLDPRADEKALWVQAKRAVLAILRVQPAKDLVESLMQPVTDEHEYVWEGILEEMERDMMRHQRRMPSTHGGDAAYRLEDIRSYVCCPTHLRSC